MIEINEVIELVLVSIYSEDILSKNLYLKGGQALRIKEKILNRFSSDADFSTPDKIDNVDLFFETLNSSLSSNFYRNGYYVFDFKSVRRPKILKSESPGFWGGWSVEFKITQNSNRQLPKDVLSRTALIPTGSQSPKITIDISEYEYCKGIEKLKIKGVIVKAYSRALLLTEKIRAICQQHPDYPHKKLDIRARDFYDIERLWIKSIKESNTENFIKEMRSHIKPVLKAKDVDFSIIHKIFDVDFLETQKVGWPQVQTTVIGEIQDFDYYVETLKTIVNLITKDL